MVCRGKGRVACELVLTRPPTSGVYKGHTAVDAMTLDDVRQGYVKGSIIRTVTIQN